MMNKIKILFVDDEPNIVSGLKRMLFSLRKEWEQHFCTSGDEALLVLEENDIDIIVSDMRMPKMNGVQLLEKVREQHPKIVRIILSGQANNELSLQSVSVAHQFLSKPCNAEDLKMIIRKSIDLKDHLHNNENIQSIIAGIDQLPVLPDIYLEIEEELNKEEKSLNRIGEIISRSPSITAKILQIVNSAFFGLPKNVSNPVEAVNFLGIGIIKSLVLYIPLFNFKGDKEPYKTYMNNLLAHSLQTGIIAMEIHNKLKLSPKIKDDIYITGLLHDIGKLVIFKNDEALMQIEHIIKQEVKTFYQAELDILGTTHAEIGAYLLGIWGLPNRIVEPIMNHHNLLIQNYNEFDIGNIIYTSNFYEHLKKDEKEQFDEIFDNDKSINSLVKKLQDFNDE